MKPNKLGCCILCKSHLYNDLIIATVSTINYSIHVQDSICKKCTQLLHQISHHRPSSNIMHQIKQ